MPGIPVVRTVSQGNINKVHYTYEQWMDGEVKFWSAYLGSEECLLATGYVWQPKIKV